MQIPLLQYTLTGPVAQLVEQRIEKVDFRAKSKHFWRLQQGRKKVRRTLFGSAANPSPKDNFKWFQTTSVAFAWLFNGCAPQLAALSFSHRPVTHLQALRHAFS